MDQQSKDQAPRSRLGRFWWVVGLAIAALIVVVLAPLASADPDGLERVAGDHGFLQSARDAIYSIIPDYTVPGVDGNLSTIPISPARIVDRLPSTPGTV